MLSFLKKIYVIICNDVFNIVEIVRKDECQLSDPLMKMWISFGGMGALILSMVLIVLSRYKLKGILSGIVAFVAYSCLIIGGIIITLVVISGPSS